ncbi:LysR family transcriptional regulator [Pseudophaeobacter arcticus]|jgi:LysR family glycine cleavage system transcriptional activator|uniref:LysR family transcriptional regulator n=1 Tax=Pseudophaeobacter arcticus TaxID=385492 RepID=UPI0024926F7D|nr:LysR family transcriptional regulator [Pseudophaeobacter arcticus]
MDWKKIPSLPALRAFEAAARHRSFTRAASELNVTQAAIAQHVRALERQLGEVLVIRDGRGIDITSTGRDLAEQLFDGFNIIAQAIDDLLRHTEERPLAIATTPGFATNWLMPRMGGFWAKHPEINVSITPGLDTVDLRKDRFDLAIRYGTGDWPGLNCELLTDGQFWVVGQPELLKARADTCLSDIVELPWLFDEAMLERRSLVESEGIDFETVNVKLLATNTLVISAVKAGMGIAIQSKSLVEDDVARGELRKICQLHQPEYGYYLASIPERDRPAIRKFRAWLRSQVKT